MMPPRRGAARDSSASITADCQPRLALTSERSAADVVARLGATHFDWVVLNGNDAPGIGRRQRPSGTDLAFLQYTSGSTSAPKGVMVSHANLVANLGMIRRAFGNAERSTYVSWVPLHHDMGLILNALAAIDVGATCILMSPMSFLQRPLTWLRAVSDFKAEVAGGPNFAFDLCVSRFRPAQMEGVDLSGWRVAFNGAEPVRAETLTQFASTFAPYGFDACAFFPCYGMAEATVLISGGSRGGGPITRDVSAKAMQSLRVASPMDKTDVLCVVGCGRALGDEAIAIVDPDNRQRLGHDEVGEIWVRGPNVGRGYWQSRDASAAFAAEIAGEPIGPWLRTGDLGFLSGGNELFVTGRIKDVIIVRGLNHYPQDIERTVQSASAALRVGYGAAFSIPDRNGYDRIVVVQEVERSQRARIDVNDLIGSIREAVAEQHELAIYEVVLVRPGTLPKTTSGKIQRRLTRQLWQDGHFNAVTIVDSAATQLTTAQDTQG